jgi:peptide deformylase
MQRKLITVPNKLLRQKSLPIDAVTPSNEQLFADLAETLLKKDDPPGVGLSAVQIGVLKRVFVTYLPPIFDFSQTTENAPESEIKFFINPEIVSTSKELTLGDDPKNPALEGCLSVPALYGPVLRYKTVTVKYQTLENDQVVTKTDTFANFFARVIQHEYDHLEGKLFTDYVKKDNRGLYFDQGENLIAIEKPLQLIQW